MNTVSTQRRVFVAIPNSAVYLGVNPRTIRRYIAEGRLKAYRIGNGPKAPIRIDVADLDALLIPTVSA